MQKLFFWALISSATILFAFDRLSTKARMAAPLATKLAINAEDPDFPLTVCGNSDIIKVTIVHTGAATDTFKNLKVGITGLVGIDFSDITVIKNGPAMITGDTLMFGDSLNSIGDSIIFQFRVKATCNFVGSSGFFTVQANFKKIGTDSTCSDQSSVLVNRADLSMPSVMPVTVNAFLGQKFQAMVTVANAGNGPLDSFKYCVSNAHPDLTLDSITVSGIKLNPTVGGSAGFQCYVGPPLPGNSQVVVKENWTVTGCVSPAPQLLRRVQYGCEGNNDCQNKTPNNFQGTDLVFGISAPSLQAIMMSTSNPACYADVNNNVMMKIVNTGTAPAKNIVVGFTTSGRFVSTYTISYPNGTVPEQVREILTNTNGCNGNGVLTAFTDTIKNINLKPSDTLKISYSTINNCNCNVCSITNAYLSAMNVLSYTDGCNVVYSNGASASTQAFNANITNFPEVAPSLLGSEMTTLSYTVNGFPLNWFNGSYPNAYFEQVIALQCGIDAIPATAKITDRNGLMWIPTPVTYTDGFFAGSDTLRMRFSFANMPPGFRIGNEAVLSVKVMGDCSEKPVPPNIPGDCFGPAYPVLIKQFTDLVIDPLCTSCTKQKIGMSPDLVMDITCPGPGCIWQGISPVFFNVERVNFGLPDANNDQVTNGVLDLSKVKRDRFLQGDTMKATFFASILDPNNSVWNYGSAVLKMPFADFTPINGQVTIKDVSSNITYTCNAINIIKNVSDSTLRVDFSAGSLNSLGCALPANFDFDNNDSVKVCLYFTTKEAFAGLERPVDFNTQFFVSDQPFGIGTPFACGTRRDRMTQIGISEAFGKSASSFGSCDLSNGISMYEQRWTGNQDFDEFPYEVRPLGIPKKVTFTKPAEFNFRLDQFAFSLVQLIDPNRNIAGGVIPGAFLSVSGNTVCFNAQDYFNSLNLAAIPMDEDYSFTFYPKIYGSCKSIAGSYNFSYQFTDSVNPNRYCTPMIMSPVATCPVTYSGGAILQVVSEITSLRLCSANQNFFIRVNNISTSNAPNAFIYAYSPTGGVVVTKIKDNFGNTITPNAFGIIPIPDLPAGTQARYEIFVRDNSCKPESIAFIAGWDCVARPTTAQEATCSTPSIVKFTTAPSGMNIDILQPAADLNINLCDTVTYTVQLRSTDLGYLRDIMLLASIPSGQVVIPGTFKLAVPGQFQGGTLKSIADATSIPGGFTLNVSSLDSVLRTDGLVGSKDITHNTVDVQFKTVTQCGYFSGSRLNFIMKGRNTCGDAITPVFKPSRRLKTTSVVPKFTVKINTNKATLNACNEDMIISDIKLQLTSGSPTNLDSIAYRLGPGIVYKPGTYTPIANASPNPPIVRFENGIQVLVWPFGMPLLPGSLVEFTVGLMVSDAKQECLDVEQLVQAYASTNANCGPTVCKIGVLAGEGSQIIQITKARLQFIKFNATLSIDPMNFLQTVVNTDIKIVNNGSYLKIGDTVRLELYEDVDNTGTRTPADVLVKTLVQVLTANLNPGDCVIFKESFIQPTGTICQLIGIINPQTTCTCSEEPSNLIKLKVFQPFSRDTFACSGSPLVLGPVPAPNYQYKWLSYLGSPLSALSNPDTTTTTFTLTNTTGSVQIVKYILRTSLRSCFSYDTVCIRLSPTYNDVFNVQACINRPYSLPIPGTAASNLVWSPSAGLTFPNGPGTAPAVLNVTGNTADTLHYLDASGCPGQAIVNITAVDCGTAMTGLGDTVWFDYNKDGLQTAGEPGIRGVTVNLYNGLNGSFLGTTITNSVGYYAFNNLPPGTYFVEFIPLPGFIPTTTNALGNTKDSLDSDMGTNGRTGNYTLPINTFNPTIDAGFIPNCDLNVDLLISECIPTDTGLVRKITTTITWSGDPYTYDQFFGQDTLYVNISGVIQKIIIDTLMGDTILCQYVKIKTTQDIIASASLFHIPDCIAADTVKMVTPCIYDLALKKELVSPGPFHYGDAITFRVVVVNQGNQPVIGVVVNDYLPIGFDFLGTTPWGYSTGSILQHVIEGPLDPGQADTTLLIVGLLPSTSSIAWLNYSEISKFRDINNIDVSTFDIDSRPDDNPNNDGGGLVNSAADNYLGGDGTSVTRDGVAATDEDDHDPALVGVFDLALIKQIDTAGTISAGTNLNALTVGSLVKFRMIVENQGNIATKNITISDYIPDGYSFTSGAPNTGWTGSAPTVAYTSTKKLVPWQRDTICIYLKIKSVPTALLTAESWVNRAEISMALDTAGVDQSANDADFPLNNNSADNVGGVLNSNSDDVLSGDGTATTRDNVAITDQDNEDPAGVVIFDLALRKTLAPGSSATGYGDTVKFNLYVINQGNQPIDSFTITDSLPSGLMFDPSLGINAGWSMSGSEVTRTVIVRLLPGKDTTVCLGVKVLRITDPALLPSAYTNFAEISSASDTTGMLITDVDSPLDTNYSNSGGGGVGTPADDYMDGTGTGIPGDGIAATDQDNSDPALVPVADLALRKIIVDTLGDNRLMYGDTLKFAIQLFNQGSVPVDSIIVVDSIPAGFALVPGTLNSAWTLLGNIASYHWGLNKTLQPGKSDTLCIYLKLQMASPSMPSTWTNLAEISSFYDTNGNPLVDIDSKPDSNFTNDAGGNPNTPSDNAINGSGTGTPGSTVDTTDEDDQDPAKIRIVDLAFVKKLAPGSIVTGYGDTVKFLLTVYNQGNVPMDSVEITDSIPSGLMFDPSLGINSGWSILGNEAKQTIKGRLLAGHDTTICIGLKVLRVTDPTSLPGAYINTAEISNAYDTTGLNVSNQDIDSPLDGILGNNGGGSPSSPADDATNGNGTGAPGSGVDSTDQDNADPAFVAVADLALRKTIVDTLGDNILLFGDTVKLAITIYNQGSVIVDSVVITDSLPAGLGFVAGPLNTGWNYGAPDATFNYNTRLNPGDSAIVYIYAKFQLATPATPKTFTNIAEISFFSDMNHIALVDVDSKPDTNLSNDAGGEAKTNSDNAINGDGTGMPHDTSAVTDEDDQDIVEIGFFDLALNKVIAPGSTATSYGDTVKYLITVTNQGSIPTDSFTITDSLPAGLMFVPANAANAGWVLSGNKVRRTLRGFLLMGMEDTTICIVLKPIPVLDPTLRAGAWTNYAEISGAFLQGSDLSGQDIDSKLDDNLGNNAGGQPESPADNTITGNGMGVIGDGIAATDQDNADPALLKIADLALRKTIAQTLTPPLSYGDTIKYLITVFNQGNVPVDSMTINDTLPNGLTFINGPLNTGWTYAANEANFQYGGDTLNPGDSFKVCIYAKLTRVTMGTPDYVNRAEISFATDTTGTPITDIDSPLDNNYGNNGGGGSGTPSDDAVNGSGTGAPGSPVDSTDQDNADPAALNFLDLAMTKKISSTTPGPYSYGSTVKFDIKIYNQGSVFTDSVEVTDYIPAGFAFLPASNPTWMLTGSNAVSIIKGRLNPGDSVLTCIYLKLLPVKDLTKADSAWTNIGEISKAYDTTGVARTDDIDSPLNNNPNDNAGGQPNSPADDAINGDGTGVIGNGVDSTDQDNADPALVMIADLALRKTIVDTLSDPLSYGDTIKYLITVFNQGNVPVDSMTINDTLPNGLTFINGPLNTGWTYAANEANFQYGGDTLNPGDSFKVCIYAKLTRVTMGTPDYVNRAEISFATDTTGTPITDIDSPLDNNYGNNGGGGSGTPSDDAVNGNGTGTPGSPVDSTDQDNADPAALNFLDLAMTKKISSTTPGPYSYGSTVKFDIKIYNQGSVFTDSVEVTDFIPAGFAFLPASNPTWMLTGSNAVSIIKGRLNPGDSVLTCIYLKLLPVKDLTKADSAWTNIGEISKAYDTTGVARTDDIDSPLNNNPNDNAGGQPNSPADDAINGDGTGVIGNGVDSTDQDNADPALVMIADLALRKTIANIITAPLTYGDTIKYLITVFNQGNVPVDSMTINDTLPNGLTFINGPLNTGWTYAANEANFQYGGDTLNPGDSFKVCIYAKLTRVITGTGIPDYINRAEISFATDTTGTPIRDIDSPLDNNYGNNGGGGSDTPSDDAVNGNGTGAPGSPVDSTDQDNADPAALNFLDLAMTKKISSTTPGPYKYGDTVKFDIKVYNQGSVITDSVQVTDYIPVGFTFLPAPNPIWKLTGSNAVSVIKGRLKPGKDTTVCIYLKLNPIAASANPDSAWINVGEISKAYDTTGVTRTDDIDSPLNNNPADNGGGKPASPADDYVDGDGTGIVGSGVDSTDQDNADPALVMILDLAQRKVLDPSSMPPYLIGDTIKFQLQVFNQGNVPVKTLTLTDSIPAGYSWDASLNPGWTGAYPKVSYVLTPATPLLPGKSDTVCIFLVIDQSPSTQGAPSDFFVNRSEISYEQDTSGNNTDNGSTVDADSKPDTILSNDAGGAVSTPSDNAIGGDGTGVPGGTDPKTDEDDDDVATLEILDIAMIKQIDSLSPAVFPLRYGYSVKFRILLENQGNINLHDIKVVDYIPSGLEYDAALNDPLGWILSGDKAKITVPDTLVPWQRDTVCIYLKLKMQIPSTDSAWTNRGEVYEVTDPRGNPRTDDVDSPLNDNPNDNAGGAVGSPADDYLSGNGTGAAGDGVATTDQDNADPAKVKIFDLALKKTTTSFVVKEGDVVPFTITVYNQGNEPLKTIKVTDYIPSDFSFSSGTGWNAVGITQACYTIAGPFNPGDSLVLPILNLKVGTPAFHLPEGLYNYAEISSALDTAGIAPPFGDIDSQWDNDPGNDTGGNLFNSDDNNVTGDHFKGEDEDDHDGAYVIVCKGFACQDKVNISLDNTCTKVVTAADVLAHADLPPMFYDPVVITDAAGKVVPNATFTRANLGYCYTFSVSATVCGANSCWGTVCVEDKFPPAIDCTPDTILCFELAQIPAEITVNDNCAGPVKVSIANEQYIDYGCDSPNIQGLVKRRLVATDPWGNSRDCEKRYYIRKVKLSDVICPSDVVYSCTLGTVSVPTPATSGAPRIGNVSLWPNNPSCKLSVGYTDERLATCGTNYKIIRTWVINDWCTLRDTICKQVIAIEDKTAPVASDRILPTVGADPHDCRAKIQLDTLQVSDCGRVTQTYQYSFIDDNTGATRIAHGTLPASVWLGYGTTVIKVTLTDECNNISNKTITVTVEDRTPPNPVCHEFTQVTVDPASCWAQIRAKDLDNGSFDNCVKNLHYAAALMTDIEKARKDYSDSIVASCGYAAYWANKAWYDQYIEEWINCYVFKDVVELTDCGTNRVVMRVYEADSMPRLDDHIWKCGEHAWFCYNTYPAYRIVHNYSFFTVGSTPTKDCNATGPWLCQAASNTWYSSRAGIYVGAQYPGANRAPVNFPQTHLYNDCMVQVLVDDKQPPLVDHLQDVTVFCDGAPYGSGRSEYYCEGNDKYHSWPGTISYKGIIHGYYGGSDFVQNHSADDHAPQVGCPNGDTWAPIYCKDWLLLDTLDQAGKINPSDYFYKYVLFDKNRPVRSLGKNEFSFTDNCKLDDASLVITNTGTINGCGEGWIQRTWTIKDKCGNPVTATQKVIVKHRSDFEVIFPADLEVTCDSKGGTDTSLTGLPKISDDECEQVGVRYEDEISTITEGACYKILRTWTLIDWCIFDANAHHIEPDVIVNDTFRANRTDRACIFRNLKDNGDGYMKYIQIIKVTDHIAPTVSCKDSTVCVTDGCSTNVNIPLSGKDNCATDLLYRVDITRPDNSTETRIDVKSISGTFTTGIYTIKITVRDHCNNEGTCTMKLNVKDCKKPTPYCLNGIATVVMPSTGSIEVWAKDLDKGSSDNCTDASKLKFSFTKNTTDASQVLTCKNIPNGKEQAIPLEIWVTDESGNQDACKTYILLQDNGDATKPGGACKDTALALATVTGRLYTEDKEGVEFANVEVKGQQISGIPAFKTSSDGSYSFASIPMSAGQSIRALRDDNPMNGVSTLDLVLIQKHILGTESLKSPYRMIAADVDNNNDITAIDLLELRKLILGLYDKLPNNTSWKFVPKSYTFSDPTNPWGYPQEDVLSDMKENMVRDFVGVKIGDINGSALPHSLMGTEIRSGENGLVFEVKDQVFKAGDKVTVEFKSPNFKGVTGFQGTMSIGNKQLAMDNGQLAIGNGQLAMGINNIGRRWEQEGMITMSWNTNISMDIKDDAVLFTMNFTAQHAGRLSEVLRIGSQHTIAESYEGKGELGNLSIRFIGSNGKEVVGKSELYQNYPNPFDQRTVIGINLADSGRGTLKITDVTGRTIKVIEQDWSKGYHEVWLDRRDIQASGVLYYSYESKTFRAVKKMVIIE